MQIRHETGTRPLALIVERVELLLLFAWDCFEEEGFEVIAALDITRGQRALEHRGPFDAAFVETIWPATDGIKFTMGLAEAVPNLAVAIKANHPNVLRGAAQVGLATWTGYDDRWEVARVLMARVHASHLDQGDTPALSEPRTVPNAF